MYVVLRYSVIKMAKRGLKRIREQNFQLFLFAVFFLCRKWVFIICLYFKKYCAEATVQVPFGMYQKNSSIKPVDSKICFSKNTYSSTLIENNIKADVFLGNVLNVRGCDPAVFHIKTGSGNFHKIHQIKPAMESCFSWSCKTYKKIKEKDFSKHLFPKSPMNCYFHKNFSDKWILYAVIIEETILFQRLLRNCMIKFNSKNRRNLLPVSSKTPERRQITLFRYTYCYFDHLSALI